MRELHVGDGHRGAASGIMRANAKAQILKVNKEALLGVYMLWIAHG